MPIFDHFSFIAPFYDRAIPLKHVESLLEHAKLPATGYLLDAGGGTGRVAVALQGYVTQTIVADVSLGMLRQSAGKNGLKPLCTYSESLPFSADLFDRVIMVDALHHVYNQRDTTRELWRVLKPGGRLVIEEPDLRQISAKFVAIAEKLVLMRSHFLSPPAIASLFRYPNARVQVESQGFNAWIIVDKIA